MGLGGVGGHVGVIAAAEHTGILSGDLGLGGVAVLGDDAAVIVLDQLLGKGGLVHLVGPGTQFLHIDLGVGVHSLGTQGKAVDAGAGLGVLSAIGGDIAQVIVAGLQALQAGGHTGQIAGLIDAAEVVVEVGVVAHIAGGVGEDHVGILRSLVSHSLHIAEGDGEDDVAVGGHQGVHGVGDLVIVVIAHLVHNDQLRVRVQTQLLHGGGDAVVVGVGIAGGVVLAVDVDGANLKVGVGSGTGLGAGGAGGAAGGGGAVPAAGGQGQGHGDGHDHCKQFLHG